MRRPPDASKPAAAVTANGLRKADLLGGEIKKTNSAPQKFRQLDWLLHVRWRRPETSVRRSAK